MSTDHTRPPVAQHARSARSPCAAAQRGIRARRACGDVDRALLAADPHAYLHRAGTAKGPGLRDRDEGCPAAVTRQRVYTAISAGLRVLHAWLNDPDPGAYRRRHPMLIKLYFAAIVVEHDAALAADGERASVAAFPACDGAIRRTSGEGRSRLAGRAARCS